MADYQLRKRLGLADDEGSAPFVHPAKELTLPYVLKMASVLTKLGERIDVLDGETYLVSYIGASPYWWLPGTHGGDLHQISSRGWCFSCDREGKEYVHHLPRAVEVAVLTAEGEQDHVFRERLDKVGLTAEQYAERTAGNKVPWERGVL